MGTAASIEQDVRAAKDALAALVPHAVSYGQDVADGIRALCEGVEPALRKPELVLAVVGDAASRRALLRAILGDGAVRGPAAKRTRTVRVRSAETFDYVARGKGEPIRFARLVPDRDATYQASIEDAEARLRDAERAREQLEADVSRNRVALRDAESALHDVDTELETAGAVFAETWRAQRVAEAKRMEIDKAAPEVPPLLVQTPPWWALWLWVLRFMLMPKWREPLALYAHNRAAVQVAMTRATELGTEAHRLEAARDDLKNRRALAVDRVEQTKAALARAEVSFAEESALAAAKARIEALLRDRSKYAGERKGEFFAALGDIDATAKGDAVDVLDIDLPFDHPGAPPKDVVLVFVEVPPNHVDDDVDGFVVVGRQAPPSVAALRARLPHAASLNAYGADVVRATLERARDRKTVVPARLALRLRACIASVADARGEAEKAHQLRLEALEKQRIPHPDDFRARQLARSEAAIDKGAGDVLTTALAHVSTGFEALGKSWAEELARQKSKRGLDACIREINEAGKVRVLELLESTCDLIVREMQSVGETLEQWALDEIQASYHTVKRRRIESLAPVASEVTSEDLAGPIGAAVPIVGPQQSFQRQRILLGLGGAASAALVGTFVRPGIGTAIGAFVGVFTLLLKSPASLRAACLDKVTSYVSGARAKVEQALREKRGELVVGIRAALDDALSDTLERLNEFIARLMKVERDAIEGEQKILSELQSTRGTLEAHDERLRIALAALERST